MFHVVSGFLDNIFLCTVQCHNTKATVSILSKSNIQAELSGHIKTIFPFPLTDY